MTGRKNGRKSRPNVENRPNSRKSTGYNKYINISIYQLNQLNNKFKSKFSIKKYIVI